MYRINLVDAETHTPTGSWYDRDRATRYAQDYYYEGANRVSSATRSQWHDEALYRTASGRWIISHTSRYGDNDSPWDYEVDEATAHDWLLRCGHADAIPAPALDARDVDHGVTPQRTIRLDDALWQATQARARAEGTDASALIRRLLIAHLA